MLIARKTLNQGGCLLSSPDGNQAYLYIPIIQFTHRVINKEEQEQVFQFLVSLLLKKVAGEGRGVLIQWEPLFVILA